MTAAFRACVTYIEEPRLVFGSGQAIESPKDGLFLFGPFDQCPAGTELRLGVIGTRDGIARLRKWIAIANEGIYPERTDSPQHLVFPGYAAVFGQSLTTRFAAEIILSDEALKRSLYTGDRNVALYNTVDLYATEIARYSSEGERQVDLWYVVIPEEIYTYGLPQSVVPKVLRTETKVSTSKKLARSVLAEGSLFAEDYDAVQPYKYDANFRNQLKIKLIQQQKQPVIQIVRETTLAPQDFPNARGEPRRRLQDRAMLAWNLATATYFKTGRRPWKLDGVRQGVCYVGIVFKRIENLSADPRSACCGAQMFLDSGDGMVFRGAIGPWYSEVSREYHLDSESAKQLLKRAVEGYTREHGHPPAEVFLHGRTEFNDAEWTGFQAAVSVGTALVGVKITTDQEYKLFRPGKTPILRGTALITSPFSGFLWTKGWVPYLKTYPGRETPNPLRIQISRGKADIGTVLRDVLGLTKLNYNACNYSSGVPVTLKFADSVGDILTAGPSEGLTVPQQFRHYI